MCCTKIGIGKVFDKCWEKWYRLTRFISVSDHFVLNTGWQHWRKTWSWTVTAGFRSRRSPPNFGTPSSRVLRWKKSCDSKKKPFILRHTGNRKWTGFLDNFRWYYLSFHNCSLTLTKKKPVKLQTHNRLIPDSFFFQGASSGSCGRGPWTGKSSGFTSNSSSSNASSHSSLEIRSHIHMKSNL